jgi:hypothetical protein
MRIDRNGSPGRLAATWTRRTAIVAAVVGITMLGNLRLQASEVGRVPRNGPAAERPAIAPETQVATERVDLAVASGRPSFDATTDEDDGSADDDSVQLVPAIYAWDPDVRFVYFRHVSKWM